MQEAIAQRPALLHRLAQSGRLDALATAGNLHIGLVWRAAVAHYHVDSAHSLPPNDSNFDLALAVHAGDHRSDAGFHEIDLRDRPVRLFEHPPEPQFDAFE